MHITKKEYSAIFSAIDFISTNSDGADDYSHYEEMQDGLRSVCEKYKKDKHKRLVKIYLRKLREPKIT